MTDFRARMTGSFQPQGYRLVIWVAVILMIGMGVIMFFWTGWPGILGVFYIAAGLIVYALLRTLLAVEANTYQANETLKHLSQHLEHITSELAEVRENILISEGAKSIAFREKDRQVLEDAIEEQFTRGNWDAARYLADQIESQLGYHDWAEQARGRIRTAQTEQHKQHLSAMLAEINDLLATNVWDRALERISAAEDQFPDDAEVKYLPEKLERAKNQRKQWLLQQWDDAVKQDNADRAIKILKELDTYLTQKEVAVLRESVRGVFRTKLKNLGIQFSMLVAEKVWDKALVVATEIIDEFPNSGMAKEIRQRMDTLKEKATFQDDVG